MPFCFVLYMVIERFLYCYPSLKYHCSRFSSNFFLYCLTIFTWLLIILIYTMASPFHSRNSKLIYATYTKKYCPYDYSKIKLFTTVRSIIYFILFLPALILIGIVLRYYFLMRGTNQIRPIETRIPQ